MFNSSLFQSPKYDLRWFYDDVIKFNAIANPEGVNEDNQKLLIKEEVQEILDSNTNQEFVDGIIDSLVVIAPLKDRADYLLWNDLTDTDFDVFKFSCERVVDDPELNFLILDDLISLIFKGQYFKECESVLESNLSKFIPVNEYKDSYLDEVKAKYPDVEVNLVKRSYNGEEYYVFLNSKTGKVLKGHSYFKEPVINLQY